MNRREAFSSLGLGIMGAIGVPTWAKAWSPQRLPNDNLGLNLMQNDLLEEITETIIPETDTPAAKTLEIAKFIKLMVTDMHKKPEHEKFKTSLEKVDQIAILLHGKSYAQCSNNQKCTYSMALN